MQLLVISDEVYKYMVYSGVGSEEKQNGGGLHAAETVQGGDDHEPAATVAAEDQPLPALRHVHFATLPGMWDRTITISSAGKTFSVTGWQVRFPPSSCRTFFFFFFLSAYVR